MWWVLFILGWVNLVIGYVQIATDQFPLNLFIAVVFFIFTLVVSYHD